MVVSDTTLARQILEIPCHQAVRTGSAHAVGDAVDAAGRELGGRLGNRTPLEKPPAITCLAGCYEIEPQQLELDLPAAEDAWPDHISLLATENRAQFYYSGFGLTLGKKSERLTVKQKGQTIGEIPLFKLQEIVVASRGIALSTDILEFACERGVRISFLSASGRPFALMTSPLLTATVETRKAQFLSTGTPIGAQIARMLVMGKLRNQEKLLRYFARNRDAERQARSWPPPSLCGR